MMKGFPIPGAVRIALKTIMLVIACIVLSSCAQWTFERNVTKGATLPATPIVLSTVTATPESTSTPSTSTPTPTATAISEPTATLTAILSPTAVFTPTLWPTVPLPEPRFSTPPSGTILALQYAEAWSRLADEDDYDYPLYGAFDSVVWAIPAEGAPYKWVDDDRSKKWLRASPDGTMVTYIVNGKSGEYTSVWMAGADGSTPQPLTPDYPKEGHLVRYVELIGWSADSKKIACVVGTRDALTRRLHIIDVPSRQITEMDLEKVGLARWVPGSNHLIALFGFEDFIFDINTQKPSSKKFFSNSSVTWPGFMPDGERGYDLSWEGVLTVYAPDGSALYQADLDFNPPDSSFFTWSPDGKWFVFSDTDRKEETLSLNIYKLNQENPTPQLVLKSSQVSVTSHSRFDNVYPNIKLFPVWSPDGKWFVVFNLFGKTGTGELYVINVETNELRTVMTISPFEPALEGVDSVVWLGSQ